MEMFRNTGRIMLSTMFAMGWALIPVAVFAQPDWSVNSDDYKYYTGVNAVVSVGGEEMAGGTLGAFINGECRGVISMEDDGIWYTRDIFSFNVYSNVKSGETIYFMFYGGDGRTGDDDDDDDDDDKGVTAEILYAITETGTFNSKGTIGNLWFPIRLYTYLDTEAPIVSSCPADITVDTDAGICGAVVNYTEPVFQDNALGTGLSGEMTAGFASGSEFPVGTTTVTYEYADASGNVPAICSFDVTVNDLYAPVPDVVSLADITAACAVTALTAPTATDNCDGSVTGTHNATLPISTQGTTTITWTYTDAAGNTSTQTQQVIIDDVTGPVPDVDPLADITAQCEVTELIAPTATDNCAGTVTGTHNATLPITDQGTTVVTWTYNDGNGNTVTQQQNVVIDAAAPPIPDVATLPVVSGACAATIVVTPTATDNCAGTIIGSTTDPLTYTEQGTYTVTWTYDDGNGNIATQTQTVIVDDVTPPVPARATLTDVTGVCEVARLTAPTATDNCGGTVTVTHDAVLPITAQGTTIVTWTYTDENDNSSTQQQNVVIDAAAPPIPDVVTLPVVSGACAATIVATPTATDNCAGTIIGTTTDPLTYTEQGTYTVTWTYDGGNGNIATQTQTVTVIDITPPTIANCPVNIVVSNNPGSCGAVVNYSAPVFADNCDGTGLAGILTEGLASGSTFPVGTTTVTYEYTDDAGNGPVACTFTVTVNDSEAPTITAPVDVTVNTDPGRCETDVLNVTLGSPVLSDNCGVQSVINDAPAVFPSGKTTVTWTVTDIHRLTNHATQVVTVVDNEDPMVMNCPVNIEADNDAGECGAVVTYTAPVFADNCDGTGLTGIRTEGLASGATFPVGTTTVTYQYTDDAGNGPVACTFTVKVNDTESPTITAPRDVLVNTDPGLCETDALNVGLGNPMTGDNCGVQSVTNNAPAVFPSGKTTVTWTVTDIHGLTSQATQVITVVDNEDPILVNCPVNIEVGNDAGECGAVVSYKAPVFADNCDRTGRAGIRTEGLASGAVFPVGTTTVTFTYTDAAGNGPVTCSFTVTVNDSEAPIVSSCPTDIEVDSDAGMLGTAITYSQPMFQDNCDGEGLTGILTDGLASGSTFPVGTTTVTYQYTDAASNTPAICTFNVTVNYINHAPTVTNPLPDLYLDEGFVTRDIPITNVFTSTDTWDVLTYTASSSAAGVVTVQVIDNTTLRITEAGIGQANITVTATDDGSPPLSVDDVFIVDVNGAPTVAAGIGDVTLDEGFVTHTIDLGGAFSDPEVDVLTYTASSNNPVVVSVEVVNTTVVVTEEGIGASSITVTARDEGGLTASTDFMFTVRNVNEAPVVANAIPDLEMADNIGTVVFDLDTVFFDNDLDALNYEVVLSNPAIVSYILSGAELTLNALETGTTEVTVRANDAALSVVDIFTITVVEEVLLIVKHEGRRMQHQDYVVVCNDAGSEQVEVVSRVNWDLRKVGTIAWLVVNIEQDSLINIAFSQNFTGADRLGEIEVYDAQGHTFTFYVKQKESCYPVGLETAFLQGMWMYPNPVEQVLYITHKDELLKDVRLEIIDGNGKILYQQEIRSSVVGRTIEVDMHGYNEGVYYIRIKAEEQFFMRKIIKL